MVIAKKEYQHLWYERNKERVLVQSKEWRKNNLEKYRERKRIYAREWRTKHPGYGTKYTTAWAKKYPERMREMRRKSEFKYLYGISPADYNRLYQQQGGSCRICKKSLNLHELHVDHSHSMNHVRGLLCGSCNRGIGMFHDNPSLLRQAAKYLEGGEE